MALYDTPTFPVRPDNRPALDRIRYRLGGYPDILESMLRELNAAPELAAWTHRAPDDPGIALLQSAAVVGDILTFYQEHYANEAFLRTAKWRESIQELVRLTGYRLAPAIGGIATFALQVRGTEPITVPAEFPLKCELAPAPDPVDFLTTTETTALPQFGKFRLYRGRWVYGGLSLHATRFEIASIGGLADPGTLDAFDLKKGDKLMLVASPPTWLTSGASALPQKASQIVKVREVTRILGRVIVGIEGHVDQAWSGAVKAYRVNRSFRHFGHNTPPKTTYQTGSGAALETQMVDAHTQRHVGTWPTYDLCYADPPKHLYTPLPINVLPLDQEVNDLSLGANVIAELSFNLTNALIATDQRKVTLVYPIRALTALTMSWGNVAGPSTWITVAPTAIVSNTHFEQANLDIRESRIHEVTSPELTLRNAIFGYDGDLASPDELFVYATPAEAALLENRRLFLRAADGRSAFVTVVTTDPSAPTYTRMVRITLDQVPDGFQREDFDEHIPVVDVFGNLVDVTQGKPEKEVALGNGDARQVFQSFKLPGSPLTYLLEPTATPSHVPELTILVSGREWTRVDALFGRGPTDPVYIVREDPAGISYVQFGDGTMGARLPSGIHNVVARFRTGSGALGPIKPGAKPSAGARLDKLDTLTLAGEVTGGAAAEDGGKARLAAPGKLQGLGRLVSIQDYESETLEIAGVRAVSAAWEILDGTPAIQLIVLLERARQSDLQFAAVEAVIRAADRARGPQRHPIRVTQGELRYAYLTLAYAPDPTLIPGDVEARVRAALGLADDEVNEAAGVFGIRRRRLGQKEYATRIEGTVQNVAGVLWCRVDSLGLLDPADDPTTLEVPASPAYLEQLACQPHELLQLHSLHLTLLPSSP